MTDINRLIYGKNDLKKIVSVEVMDDLAEIFVQQDDGSIVSNFVPHKYWLLSNKQLDRNFIRMKGELHYKWGKQFDNKTNWQKAKNYFRNDDIYTIHDPKENFLVNKGYTYHKGLKPSDVSILSFDIETTGFSGFNDKLLLISNTFRDSTGKIIRKLFSYDDYKCEGDMLFTWITWVQNMDPSIICGHNIYSFDLVFLQEVADREQVELNLGRNNSPLHFNNYESQKRKDGSQSIAYHKVKCYGRELIDTMFLAITYDVVTKKYESYALKKIIEAEGIRFEGRVMYDASKIRDNYTNLVEWEKIKKYCEHDSDEALALFDLMAPSFFYLTQSVPKSFQMMVESATGSQINSVMVRSYLQEAHSLPKADMAEKFQGAHSGGIPGIYKNCIKWDVASLYPSIMIEYEVCNWDKDPAGHFLSLVRIFTEERLKNKRLYKETKDKYYDDLQGSQKVFINSCYGFLGTSGLNFNSLDHAEFITAQGRAILEHAVKWATGNELKTYIKEEGPEENDSEL